MPKVFVDAFFVPYDALPANSVFFSEERIVFYEYTPYFFVNGLLQHEQTSLSICMCFLHHSIYVPRRLAVVPYPGRTLPMRRDGKA